MRTLLGRLKEDGLLAKIQSYTFSDVGKSFLRDAKSLASELSVQFPFETKRLDIPGAPAAGNGRGFAAAAAENLLPNQISS